MGGSLVSNSAIHHGLGFGVHMLNSANVILRGNNMYAFTKFGINIDTSDDITIDNNWVIGVAARNIKVAGGADPVGAILGCANLNYDTCARVVIKNNLVSGAESAGIDTTGYSVMAHTCGDYNTITFRDNVAHSIEGTGAIIFRDV